MGTRKWVGASEAAAILRSAGLRAMVADFRGAPGARCLCTLVLVLACGILPVWVQVFRIAEARHF